MGEIEKVYEGELPGIEYSSNNSGGDWWLSDDDWYALERAGWEVEWVKGSIDWQGHVVTEDRWLGALAKRAVRRGLSMSDAVAEWESITGQYADDPGCSCCGAPHYFSEEW